jgi:hypothetical protein
LGVPFAKGDSRFWEWRSPGQSFVRSIVTRILLFILAVLEIAVGLFGLITATTLLLAHDAGMVMIFWPILATMALCLVAAATIFIRRPWSYWVHIAVILLIGVLITLYLAPLFGADALIALLPVGLIVAALTAVFFLPTVRRQFGL